MLTSTRACSRTAVMAMFSGIWECSTSTTWAQCTGGWPLPLAACSAKGKTVTRFSACGTSKALCCLTLAFVRVAWLHVHKSVAAATDIVVSGRVTQACRTRDIVTCCDWRSADGTDSKWTQAGFASKAMTALDANRSWSIFAQQATLSSIWSGVRQKLLAFLAFARHLSSERVTSWAKMGRETGQITRPGPVPSPL